MAYEQDYWTQFQQAPDDGMMPPPDGRDVTGGTGFLPGEVPPGSVFPTGGQGPTAPVPPPGGQTGGGQAWDEARFTSTFGRPGTPQELIALEAQLNAQGITVMRNAAGVAGKIRLPNGQIIDVINAAGAGGRGFQWLTGDGGEGGNPGYNGGGQYGFGDWTAPFTERYSLPTYEELQHMPGYQAGLQEYRNGIESSAAAKGTLLTGGTLQRLGRAGTDYANQAYGQLAGLGMQEFGINRDIFYRNQDAPFDKYYSLARLGQ